MRFLVVYDITYKREYGHNARRAKMPKINYKSIVNDWTYLVIIFFFGIPINTS